MKASAKSFIRDLRRVHAANGLPVDQKLPEKIEDHPRDTCADCNQQPQVTLTVEDILGNERVVCLKCWKAARE